MPYVGEICMVAFRWAPQGWRICDGSLLPIGEYEALFTLLGTTYGGDGQTTFALPDLRGRLPLGAGAGPDLPRYDTGETGGAEAVTLDLQTLAPHTHLAQASSAEGTSADPTGNVWAGASELRPYHTPPRGGAVPMNAGSVEAAGGGTAHDNLQPYTVINYIIALEGVYPTQG